MLYAEKDRTGMIWSKFVSAWTFANVVLKAKRYSNLFGGCSDICVWADPALAPPVTQHG
jgi:hypothetical protein